MRSSRSCKGGTPHQATRNGHRARVPIEHIGGLQGVDFSALRGLMECQSGNIRAQRNLMRAVPVARSSYHVRDGLQAATSLLQVLKVISGGLVDEKDVGERALRSEIEHAAVLSDAEFKECFVKPDLVFQGNKGAALIGGRRGGLRVEGVQAQVIVGGAIVEQTCVQDVLGREVVLQAEKVVSCPFFESVGARPKLFDNPE